MDPGTAYLASGLIGGAADFLGGRSANRANRDMANTNMDFQFSEASRQMEFQERMSGSAYQRSVADLKAAGMNPMLAYTQGGASSPPGARGTGAQAHATNAVGPAVATALAAVRARAEIKAIEASTRKTEAETPGAAATSSRLERELKELVPVHIQTAEFERDVKATQALVASIEFNVVQGNAISKHWSKLVHDHFQAKYRMVPVELRTKLAEVTIKELLAKGARGADEGYSAMKRGAAWVGEKAGALTNSAVDAVRGMRHGYDRFKSNAQYRRKYEFRP